MSDVGLNMDFGGGVKAASGFDPIPEGKYRARIDEIEVKDTKPKDGEAQVASDGSQAQYLNVTYLITEGEYADRKLWGINSIRFPKDANDDTKKERQTRELFLKWLNDVTGTDFAGTNQTLNLTMLMGSVVDLIVTQRTYEGTVQNNIKRVMPPSDSTSEVDAIRRTL